VFEAPIEQLIPILTYLGNPTDSGGGLVAIARLDTSKTDFNAISSDVEAKPHTDKPKGGNYAQRLYNSFFMRNDKVIDAICAGDEEYYLKWIRKQPSALNDDTHNIEACHVRAVEFGAGTGRKPPYAAIPMTHDQHKLQHNNGESACLKAFNITPKGTAHEWFKDKAMQYREEFVKLYLRDVLLVSSLSGVTREMLLPWAEENGLLDILP
jgi:hypothetical protein